MQGKLYGIGIGPGDPGLITVKALEILKAADVVCVPKGDRSEGSLAQSIIQGLLPQKEYLTLRFPMVYETSYLETHWGAAAEAVAEKLALGKCVAFITLGDPTLYSTYIYLLRALTLTMPDLCVETIPGVTSVTASAALANLPLAEGEQRLAIVPGSTPEASLRRIMREFDTVVLMKIGKRLPQIQSLIAELGLSANAVLVSRAGLSGQTVVRDTSRIDDPQMGYLSLIIVRNSTGAMA
ncbi:MAG: precorrin-2 C(20)-methyltransferase [Chloroflexi bacterium]|nr:precorrin-2 C(20)-methyltransferase [Chloroflexota bacterium]